MNLNVLENRLNLSKRYCIVFATLSIMWLTGCLLTLFIPPIRDLVIRVFEFFARRPLVHPVWHSRFIIYGTCGFILYAILFMVFFSDDFAKQNTEKKQLAFIAAFAVLAIFVIMFRANWTFSDDHGFITTTAVNNYYAFDVYSSIGRFFPLGHFHYNLPLFIIRLLGVNTGLSVELHYVLVALFFMIAFLCLYGLFKKIWLNSDKKLFLFPAFFACAIFVLAVPFTQVFMSLIYPETPVIMLFSFFAFMYYQGLKTDKRRYYVAALFAALYATYCKEPVFGVFVIIALVNHLFRLKKESENEKLFYAALIINGILFVCLYYFFIFKNATGFYNDGRTSGGRLQLMLSILKGEPILALMFLFGSFRLFCLVVKKDWQHIFFDSLLFAGIGYVAAYVLLRLTAGYYLVPSVVLFAPSLVYWLNHLFQKENRQSLRTLCLFFIFLFVFAFGLGTASRRIGRTWRERTEFMPYMESLFLEYKNGKEFIWYESDITGFAIQIRNWKKSIENAFLNYLNRSEGIEFFSIHNNTEDLVLDETILFFYPSDNNQGRPMPESLVETLGDNNFVLYKDSYDVLIFKKKL